MCLFIFLLFFNLHDTIKESILKMKFSIILKVLWICGSLCNSLDSAADTVCPDEWKEIIEPQTGGRVCLKLVKKPEDWDRAQKVCNIEVGHLLTLNNNFFHEANIDNVENFMKEEIYNVLENSVVSAVWTSVRISGGKLWWMDILPEPVQSAHVPALWNWAEGQPTPKEGKCGRLGVSSGLSSRSSKLEMSLHSCDSQLPFLCISNGFKIKPAPAPDCPPGWLGSLYSDKCYRYSHTEDTLSYTEAQQACQHQDSHLATPNSGPSFQLVRAVVHDQSGVQCFEYTGALNEEDAKRSAISKRCNPGEVCQTTVDLSTDKIIYSKKCEDLDICTSNLDINRSLCYSGDLVFQAGFTELQCFDCCNTLDCTDTVVERGGPLAQTLTTFENRMSPPRSKRQTDNLDRQIAASKYWIGLRKQRNQFTWESGEAYNANRSHFGALFESQPDEGCVSVGAFWEVISCDQSLPYVCQRTVKFKKVEVTGISANRSLYSKSIEWSHGSGSSKCEENEQSPHLCCEVQGDYHPTIPIVWVKDGIYISNGPPPGGFKLEITRNLQFHLDIPHQNSIAYLQGFYHCEIWSLHPHIKVASPAVYVDFKDIRTYRGSLRLSEAINNVSSIQSGLLEWGFVLNELTEYQWLLETLMKVTLLSRLLVPSVDITNIRDLGKVMDFTIHFHLTEYNKEDWLKIKDVLNINLYQLQTRSIPYHRHQTKQKMSWFIDELDEKFLIYLKNKILLKMQDHQSDWNQFYGQFKLTGEDLSITSTVVCPSTIIKHHGEMFRFIRSEFGDTAMSDEVCMSDGQALASLRCEGDFYTGGLWRDLVTYRHCVQPQFSQTTQQLKDLSQREVNTDTVEDVSREMIELTHQAQELDHPGLIFASKVVRNVALCPRNTIKVGNNILQTVNNLMSVSDDVLKNAQKVDKAATRLLESFDTYSVTAALEETSHQRIVQAKLALEIWQYDNTSESVLGFGAKSLGSRNMLSNDSIITVENKDRRFLATEAVSSDIDVAVFFSPEVIGQVQSNKASAESPPLEQDDPFSFLMDEQPVRIKFMIYQDPGLFLSPSQVADDLVQIIPGGQVVAGSILGVTIQNLSEPVTMIFNPKSGNISDNHCAFWDFSAFGGQGNWSTEGCWLNGTENNKVICHCDHLTNFAIITEVERGEIPKSHQFALSVISVVGAILSILGLTLTILTFILFRKLRKGVSQKTLVNLAVALLCTNVIFLCGIDRTENYRGCAAIAAILHYFLLASFSWMLVEGILHYLKFVRVLDSYVHRFMLKASVFAWGAPAVVVILVACVDWRLFRGHNSYCWLSELAFYYSFVLPVCCILLVNTVLFILVVKGITWDRPKGLKSTQSDSELVALQVKAAVSCFILLGLTWVFGFLAINNARLVFQYIFCILNAFHGFWIFLNYCIREPSVRHHWRQFVCCKYSLIGRKYSHTVSSGVFSSSGHSNDKNVPTVHLTSRNGATEETTGERHGSDSKSYKEDSGTVSTALSSRFNCPNDGSSAEGEDVCQARLNEPVYENWNNYFLEQSTVSVNMNTGIPYKSSLPRNKKGFGLEGLYNDAYQNLEVNTSDV